MGAREALQGLAVVAAVVGTIYGGPIGFGLGLAAIGLSVTANTVFAPGLDSPKFANNFQSRARDRLQNVRSALISHIIPYGCTRVAVRPYVFAQATNPDNRFLHLIGPVAGSEVDDITHLILDDEILAWGADITEATGVVQPSEGRFAQSARSLSLNGPIVRVFKHLGTADQVADATAVSELDNWTNDHRGRGIAYLYIRLQYNKSTFSSGIPKIGVVVKGRKVYDPRQSGHDPDDASTWEWSNNWALCLRDYLTNTEYGLGARNDEINEPLLIEAANISDECVETGREGTVDPGTSFNVLRGTTTIPSSASTVTLTESTDYTLPASSNGTNTFIRIVNSRLTGMGRTDDGSDTLTPAEATVWIQNPSNIGVSITFERFDAPGFNCRIDYEIIQFTGQPASENEIVVRDVDVVTIDDPNTSMDGASIGTISDPDDVVVFITGEAHESIMSGFSAAQWTAELIDNGDGTYTPRFTKSATSSTFTNNLSYAVVEFTGSSWTVHREEMTIEGSQWSSGSPNSSFTHTLSFTIADITKTFFHYQHRISASGTSAQGDAVELDTTTTIRIRMSSPIGNKTRVLWIVENSGNMFVEQVSFHDATEDAESGEREFTQTITNVSAQAQTSIMGESCSVETNDARFCNGYINFRLTAPDTVTMTEQRDDMERRIAFQVVQWPTEAPFTVGGSPSLLHKRYTCDGVVDTADQPNDIIEELLTAGVGSLSFAQGTYNIFAGAYTEPVQTLTADDLIGEIEIEPNLPRSELFNGVRGTFVDPSNNFQPTDFPARTNASYEVEDGDIQIFRDIELPFTQDNVRAQRIAEIHLKRSRLGLTVTFPCKLTALKLALYDTVKVTLNEPGVAFGWVEKPFRIIGWQITEELKNGVILTLRTEESSVYDWDASDAILFSGVPALDLPDISEVAPPTDVTLTSGTETALTTDDGVVIPRIKVAWTAPADFNVTDGGFIEIQWRETDTSSPANADSPSEDIAWGDGGTLVTLIDGALTSAFLLGVEHGVRYIVRVRSVSASGAVSDDDDDLWLNTLEHTVVGQAPTKTVTLTNIDTAQSPQVTADFESLGTGHFRVGTTELSSITSAVITAFINSGAGRTWELISTSVFVGIGSPQETPAAEFKIYDSSDVLANAVINVELTGPTA